MGLSPIYKKFLGKLNSPTGMVKLYTLPLLVFYHIDQSMVNTAQAVDSLCASLDKSKIPYHVMVGICGEDSLFTRRDNVSYLFIDPRSGTLPKLTNIARRYVAQADFMLVRVPTQEALNVLLGKLVVYEEVLAQVGAQGFYELQGLHIAPSISYREGKC